MMSSVRLASEISGQPEALRVPHFKSFRMQNRKTGHFFLIMQTDVDKMKQAASYLSGRADFRSFVQLGHRSKQRRARFIPVRWRKTGMTLLPSE